jgi:hypothetical protein
MAHDTSRARRLDALKKTIDQAHGFWGADSLRSAVDGALKEPAPRGRPAGIGDYAYQIAVAGKDCDSERTLTSTYAQQTLPRTWFGMTAVSAADAMSALDGELRRTVETFDKAGAALRALADSITEAQRRDALGRGPLEHAKQLLDHLTKSVLDYDGDRLVQAHREAREGIAHLVAAAHLADDAGHFAARQLNELSAGAHNARLKTGTLTDLDKLVITGAAVPAPPGLDDFNLILTADAAGRATDRLELMSADDRRRFETLLARGQSAQERAYLLQVLAAGHSFDEIEAFSQKIHAHGGDPAWLRDRLTPIATRRGPDSPGAADGVEFDGEPWTQGQHPTCVAASTVLARAHVDPMYALDLTTGGHPDDPRHDSGDAFRKRLIDEQYRMYGEGRWFLEDWLGKEGVGASGTQDMANVELHGPTGRDFEVIDVNSASDRRDALPTIETTVDQGVPVPFGVTDDHTAHEMVVIGHEGDLLQIYNPWGTTMWVSEDAFVNGHLDVVGQGVPANFDDVTLPKR